VTRGELGGVALPPVGLAVWGGLESLRATSGEALTLGARGL